MMSTPASTCCRTISATARCTRASKTAGSGVVPASRASNVADRSGGRGRLPVWVVRIRSVLRFMVDCSSVSPHAGLWYAYDGPLFPRPCTWQTPAALYVTALHTARPDDQGLSVCYDAHLPPWAQGGLGTANALTWRLT